MPDFGASMAQAPRARSRPGCRTADVGGAEVKGFARDVDLDGVEEFAVEDFDADDVGVKRGDEFLDEGGAVEAELESVGRGGGGVDGGLELREGVEAFDAGTGAADVGLDDDGPAEAFGCSRCLRCAVDDAGLRVGDAERVHEGELAGLGELGLEGFEAVDDTDAAGFEVLKEAEGVEDLVAVVAVPGRGGHAVEDERILFFRMVFRGVEVVGREEFYGRIRWCCSAMLTSWKKRANARCTAA